MDNEFRKENLSNGCIVQTRDGRKWIYLENVYDTYDNQKKDIFVNLKNGGYWELCRYKDNLIHYYDKDCDIMKICNMNYVGRNIRNHIINDTDEWTAVREENKEEELDEVLEEINTKREELNGLIKIYKELKDEEVKQ